MIWMDTDLDPPSSTASRRDRSGSPHCEASNIMVPPETHESDDAELRHFIAFLARRQSMFFLGDAFPRRNVKLDREINYKKGDPDVQHAWIRPDARNGTTGNNFKPHMFYHLARNKMSTLLPILTLSFPADGSTPTSQKTHPSQSTSHDLLHEELLRNLRLPIPCEPTALHPANCSSTPSFPFQFAKRRSCVVETFQLRSCRAPRSSASWL